MTGNSAEAIRESITRLVGKSQRIHFLLIVFSLAVFLFGYVEIAGVQKQKREAVKILERYYFLQRYAQELASKIRERLLLYYADEEETEEARIFVLISDISTGRFILDSILWRISNTIMTRPDVLPIDGKSDVSPDELLGPVDSLRKALYFERIVGADPRIGTFAWGVGLHDMTMGDLSRLAFALSVSPRQIVESLSRYVSKEPFNASDIGSIRDVLLRLKKEASQMSQVSLQEDAVRLWNEWVKYLYSGLAETPEIEISTINSSIKLCEQNQSRLDKLSDWEEGKRGVVLPGVPGEMQLGVLIRVTPYVITLVFLLMTLFVIQAEAIVTTLKKPERDSLYLSYIQLISSGRILADKLLVRSLRYLMLGSPSVVTCWIGLSNPVLRPTTEWA